MNAFFKYVFTVTVATLFLPFTFAFGFPWDNASKNEISWMNNLKAAQKLSQDTGRPILLHFFSDTCPPCKMMEKNTFPNPMIAETVKSSFIPVKLNVKHNPREAKMFNVQSVPMDIILSSDGQQLQAAVGGQDANRYRQFLATAQKQLAIVNDKLTNEEPFPNASVNVPDGSIASTQQSSPFIPNLPDKPPFPPERQIEMGGACPIEDTPSFDYASIPDEEKAKIEFEGYCPVELGKRSMWVRGDYNNRLLFEGRLYLFAGKEQMEEFKLNPEKYAPAYQGIDIVIWKERGERVQGVRDYGGWALGRVFLFSSEENLSKFEKNARYYLTPNKN